MPLALQAKLLRVLQEREVDRLGGKKPLAVDIRVVATTNRDLREMIRAGAFREDLFYRLNVVPVRLYPLRERMEDIELLARSFFANRGYAGAALSTPALVELQNNSWRGNVRELFNVLERAAIMADGAPIGPEHLLLDDEFGPLSFASERIGLGMRAERSFFSGSAEPQAHNEASGVSMKVMEQQLIHDTLRQTNDNRTMAAKLLGISVRTLRNKLKLYRERERQAVM
jgi:two-component system response regulator FlrC